MSDDLRAAIEQLAETWSEYGGDYPRAAEKLRVALSAHPRICDARHHDLTCSLPAGHDGEHEPQGWRNP